MVDAAQSVSPDTRAGLPVFNIAGAAFRTYGKAFPVFLALSIAASLPSFVYLIFFPPLTPTALSRTTWIISGVHLLLLYFLQIPMTYIAVRLFEGQAYSLAEGLRLGVRRYLPVLGASILTIIAVYGGMILLIVPGIIFACMFALVVPVCALEPQGPIAAMKRSKDLTRYNRWRILGVYALFVLPLMIASGLVAFLVTMRGHLLAGQWTNLHPADFLGAVLHHTRRGDVHGPAPAEGRRRVAGHFDFRLSLDGDVFHE